VSNFQLGSGTGGKDGPWKKKRRVDLDAQVFSEKQPELKPRGKVKGGSLFQPTVVVEYKEKGEILVQKRAAHGEYRTGQGYLYWKGRVKWKDGEPKKSKKKIPRGVVPPTRLGGGWSRKVRAKRRYGAVKETRQQVMDNADKGERTGGKKKIDESAFLTRAHLNLKEKSGIRNQHTRKKGVFEGGRGLSQHISIRGQKKNDGVRQTPWGGGAP